MTDRREKVILSLDDHFSGPMMKAAAATHQLDRELDSLSGSAVRSQRSMTDSEKRVTALGNSSEKSGKQIDKLSGRLALIAQAAAILGPALVPIGAVGIPAVTGLAAQLGAAALAGGTAIVAFQGVGDALKAANKAAIEPTAANLEAARIAMQKIGPEARAFVTELRGMGPAFQAVRNAAAAGLFPGLTESLADMEVLLPKVETIMFNIGDALGSLAGDSAGSLAGPRWAEFMSFLATDVPATLTLLGKSIGNLTHGLAEMWMAFDPLNDGFSSWMLEASRGFDTWAQGLAKTEGFAEFVDYIQANGPRVADALGSIGNAVLEIVKAAAPLGGPVLESLAAVADAIAAIAGSDAGPAIMATVTALALLSRGMKTFEAVSASSWGKSISGAEGYVSKVATLRSTAIKGSLALGGLGVAATGAADGIGLTNTVSGAMLGSLAGPWGAAVGGAVGLMMDFSSSNKDTSASVAAVTATLNQQTGAITANTREWAAKELLDSGALEQAQRLGLNLSMVTDAALGNKDAIAQVNAEMQRLNALSFADPGNFDAQLNKDVEDFGKNLFEVAGITKEAQAEFGLMKAATAGVSGGFKQGASAAQTFRDSVLQLTAALAKRASFRDYEAALDDFADSLDNVKDKAGLLNKNGKINISIPAGREVQAKLDNIAATAIKVAENLKGADRVNFLARARKDFVEVATLLLGDKDAARALANELGLLDKKRAKPKVELDGWANAILNANRVRDAIGAIRDKTVTIRTVQVGGRMGPQIESARGNLFAGDIANRHQPSILNGDVARVWNEPETRGESYIPHANDSRRPRAKAILSQTAAMFGGEVQWNAFGSVNLGSALAGSGQLSGAGYDRRYERRVSVAQRSPSPSQPIVVNAQSLKGLRIEGRVDVDGREGYIRGVIREEIAAEQRFDRVHRGR